MKLSIPFVLVWGCLSVASIQAESTELLDETTLETLFAFDQHSIPFTQNLRLEMRRPTRHPGNPVVARGPAGSPDAMGVQFYGSIIREGNKYRMWYVAYDDDNENKVATSRWRAAYAESLDGIQWTKPDLGLVEFHGNKHNNLIRTEPAPWGFVNLKVLHEPDSTDPEQRYKIATHVYYRHNTRLGTLAPFVSRDGLTWKLLGDAKPIKAELSKSDLYLPNVHFEPCGGLYKWDGQYYVCGQNAMASWQPHQGRIVRMYRSPDFVDWKPTNNIGFVRLTQHEYLGPGRSLEGEQTHEAISVWNRKNVLLGVYGQWHGAKEWKDITVDLGFVVANDGLNFREPAQDWTFLERGKDGEWDQGGLLQGQGFENVGDQTFVYYGAWDPRARGTARGGVGIAVLPRDRFGDLMVDERGKGPGDYQQPEIVAELVTTKLQSSPNETKRFFANVDGLGPNAKLFVELLDALERPLPGFSGENAAIVSNSGFQSPIAWNGKADVAGLPSQYRIHIRFDGKESNKIRLSAVYGSSRVVLVPQ